MREQLDGFSGADGPESYRTLRQNDNLTILYQASLDIS
jgi:hypothetical protein